MSRRGSGEIPNGEVVAGRTVLVAGGGTGIGAAICHELAVHGAEVALLDADAAAAHATARRIRAIGAEALAIVGDASREEDATRAAAAAHETFGRLDAVVACCRAGPAEPLDSLAAEAWQSGMEGALRGVFLITRAALPLLKRRGFGNVVCVCETEAETGAARASQWALLGFCDALRTSQARHRIRVSAVLAPHAGLVRCAPPELEVAGAEDALEAAAIVREMLAGPRVALPVLAARATRLGRPLA